MYIFKRTFQVQFPTKHTHAVRTTRTFLQQDKTSKYVMFTCFFLVLSHSKTERNRTNSDILWMLIRTNETPAKIKIRERKRRADIQF